MRHLKAVVFLLLLSGFVLLVKALVNTSFLQAADTSGGGLDAKGEQSGLLPVSTVLISNAPPKRAVDLVIVGDGYVRRQNRQGGLLEQQARSCIRHFFQAFPFTYYRDFFNVYLLRSVSQEAGIDQGREDLVKSLFDVAANTAGLPRLLDVRKRTALAQHVRQAPDADIVFVLANSSRYCGGGGVIFAKETLFPGRGAGKQQVPAPVFAAGHPQAVGFALHELGHGLADLADEYVDEKAVGAIERVMPFYESRAAVRDYLKQETVLHPNVDTNATRETVKWRRFFRFSRQRKMVGVYAGGSYLAAGVYRPARTCRMRSLDAPFCLVCRKALVRALYRIRGDAFDEDRYHKTLERRLGREAP